MANVRIVGFHAVHAKLRNGAEAIEHLYVDMGRRDARMLTLISEAEQAGVRVSAVPSERLHGMCPNGVHQGVIAFVKGRRPSQDIRDLLDEIDGDPLLLVLDGVTDPRNLGACLRIADAVGASAVVAPKDRAAGLSDVACKAACGAAETIPYCTVTNLARTLRDFRQRGIHLIGLSDDAPTTCYQASWPTAVAWVLGAEGEGLRRLTRETCDQLLSIPMYGSVTSLNVATAASVCLYETRRRQLPA